MSWPPKVGESLPRAGDAWYDDTKLDVWILGDHGHGPEWERVFRVDPSDRQQVWEAITNAVANATVSGVRELGKHGLNCEIDTKLTIGTRTATVRVIWHYVTPDSAPRLVSAFPRL